MITYNADNQTSNGDHNLEVTLYSNRFELDFSVSQNGWGSTISLNKEQLNELIVALVEMEEEML